jgi:hypothetical protein
MQSRYGRSAFRRAVRAWAGKFIRHGNGIRYDRDIRTTFYVGRWILPDELAFPRPLSKAGYLGPGSIRLCAPKNRLDPAQLEGINDQLLLISAGVLKYKDVFEVARQTSGATYSALP